MVPRTDRPEQLAQLTLQVHEGRIGRRTFITRALALGLSLAASDTIFRTYSARAQDESGIPLR